MIWSESQSGQRMKRTCLKKDYDSKFCPFILLMRALPQQEGVLHPLHQGLGRAQALKYQGRGAAVVQEIHPPQGAGLVAETDGIAGQKA